MSTLVTSTKITFKYLMNKTKSDLATWLLTQLDFIESLNRFHPRAMKLMRKKKKFIVVADDEWYFEKVYEMIRSHEQGKGTWTEKDEEIFQSFLDVKNRPIFR